MDVAVTTFYETWKDNPILQPVDKNDEYYILLDNLYKGYAGAKECSDSFPEAHGYGMMITAIMAGSEDKRYFDGALSFL